MSFYLEMLARGQSGTREHKIGSTTRGEIQYEEIER